MFYLDASFVGALFQPEIGTEKATAWLRAQPHGVLHVSDWLAVEFASMIARRVRTNELSPEQGKAVVELFRHWQDDHCHRLEPDAADYEIAAAAILQFNTALRSGDALHLAVARNNGNLTLVTFDRGMARAATMLGLPVEAL